ncbi:hypothetical protein H9P43_003949 [Blastocladiella emersonii ATCC 22665]|nr:hypothetical protein H9P43_003949 [Blastocladiella emersonii ATCC 22665]
MDHYAAGGYAESDAYYGSANDDAAAAGGDPAQADPATTPALAIGAMLWRRGYYSDVTLDFGASGTGSEPCAALGIPRFLYLHAAVLAQCGFFAAQLAHLVRGASPFAGFGSGAAPRAMTVRVPDRPNREDMVAFYTTLRLLYTKRFTHEFSGARWAPADHEYPDAQPVANGEALVAVAGGADLAVGVLAVCLEVEWDEGVRETWRWLVDYCARIQNDSLLGKLTTAYPELAALDATPTSLAPTAAAAAVDDDGSSVSGGTGSSLGNGAPASTTPTSPYPGTPASAHRGLVDVEDEQSASVETPGSPPVPDARTLRGELAAHDSAEVYPDDATEGSYLTLSALIQLLLNAAQAYAEFSAGAGTSAEPTEQSTNYLALDAMVRDELAGNPSAPAARDLDEGDETAAHINGEAFLGAMDSILTDLAQNTHRHLSGRRAPDAAAAEDPALAILTLSRMAAYLLRRSTEAAVLPGHRMLLVLQFVSKVEYLVSTASHARVHASRGLALTAAASAAADDPRGRAQHDLLHNLLPTLWVDTYPYVLELILPSNEAARYLSSAQIAAISIRLLQLASHARWRTTLRYYLCAADAPWDAYFALLIDSVLEKRHRKELITALVLSQRLGVEIAAHHFPDLHITRRDRFAKWSLRGSNKSTTVSSSSAAIGGTWAASGSALSPAILALHTAAAATPQPGSGSGAPKRTASGRSIPVQRRQSVYRNAVLKRHSVMTPEMQQRLDEMLALSSTSTSAAPSTGVVPAAAPVSHSPGSSRRLSVVIEILESSGDADDEEDAGAHEDYITEESDVGPTDDERSSESSSSSDEGDEADAAPKPASPTDAERFAEEMTPCDYDAALGLSPPSSTAVAAAGDAHVVVPRPGTHPAATLDASTVHPSAPATPALPAHEIMAGARTLQRMAHERHLVARAQAFTEPVPGSIGAAPIPRSSWAAPATTAVSRESMESSAGANLGRPSMAGSRTSVASSSGGGGGKAFGGFKIRNPLKRSKPRMAAAADYDQY